jgi:calcineurin-like phosphoesterase family protein
MEGCHEKSSAQRRGAMTTLFTADTHFGHLGAMKKFRRPFQDVREMNQTLIGNWNSVVQPEDWVFHLGDFGKWAGVNLEQVFNLLSGTKVLIVGNHDSPETLSLSWREKAQSAFVTVGGQRAWLSHHPRRSWNEREKGTWHLYGHVHGSKRLGGFSLDVGVDCWGFQPISFAQIKERLHALNGLD